MASNQPTAAPAGGAARYQRRLKNYLLDAPFQLKFAGYLVAITLVLSAGLGVFLYRTTNDLFAQLDTAAEARSKAAETSHELGQCTLNASLAQNMDDPAFMAQLDAKSSAIDKAYEAEKEATKAARVKLVDQQRHTMMGLIGGLVLFIIFVGAGTIVVTHRIVGPLFRVKRMANEVAGGKIRPPAYGLRPGDELQDLFEAFANMVTKLREREEALMKSLDDAAAAGTNEKLEAVRASIKARLDQP
jgi:nitrogen fixation/metabolism regulation signal transduction histidine kinase